MKDSIDNEAASGRRVAILGAGAWGTALAVSMLEAGHSVRIWARSEELASEINDKRTNRGYLPDIRLPDGLQAVTDTGRCLEDADLVLSVVPAQVTADVLQSLGAGLAAEIPVLLCAKGIDRKSGKLLSQIVEDVLPNNPIGALSGPSFAADVARGLPTAVTVAAENETLAFELAQLLSHPNFRCYSTDDLIGVEVGGALKNVLAIAAGICSGLGLGASAHAAMITRGFVELRRIGVELGGQEETLMGLSGLGDLILTCSSTQSRNFSYGAAFGRGESVENRPLAEGVFSARIAHEIAKRHKISTPIIGAVDRILSGEQSAPDALEQLMTRPLKQEGL